MSVRLSSTLATILLAAPASLLSGVTLTANSTVLATVAAGQDYACTLLVPAGQAAELSIVEKQALAGLVEVRAEDGTEVHADLHLRSPSAKRLTLVSGRFEIRFVPANHSPMERIFELHSSEFHAATADDRSRAEAEKLLGEGEQEEKKFDPAAKDQALVKYEAALAVLKRLGDKLQQADTLRRMGAVRQLRQEMPKALDEFRQALDLSRAANEPDGIGWALIGIANVETDTGQARKGVQDADEARAIMDSTRDLCGRAWARLARGGSINGSSDVDRERANDMEALTLAQRAVRFLAQKLILIGVRVIPNACDQFQPVRKLHEVIVRAHAEG